MIWQYSPFFIPYVACGLILAILGITGWRNRTHICARSFTVLMFAASIWAFCTALELASADLQTQMLAIMLEYPAMVIIPVGWLLFAIEYTGRDDWITTETVVLLCIVPAITVIMVVTNDLHYLFYPTMTETIIGGLSYHVVTYGPAFWVHTLYSYILVTLAILLILQRFLFSSPVYRGQVTVILIATLLPLMVNLILVFRVGSVALIDPTPFALLIAGLTIMIGMVRFQLLDITPVAQEQILANMNDGIIVIDIQGRIISLNPAAERFLGRAEEAAIGTTLLDAMPASLSECIRTMDFQDTAEHTHEIEREVAGKMRYFELRCIPLRSRGAVARGKTILIRDITDQKQTQIALFEARKEVSLLSSITRHDILNQVTALLLHIAVAKDSVPDKDIQEWLAKQEESVERIQHQVEFARDYEDLGVRPPEWIDIARVLSGVRALTTDTGITWDIQPGQVEVFSDPLLERVFYNLVDNSVRHGEHVTIIRYRYEVISGELSLVYEDNGVGIPNEAKKKIFERGVGRQTGLGLFLVAEILGITGITIRECGEPGKGARFEMHVPSGMFRIAS